MGVRPKGAKNCCLFLPCKKKYQKYPKSYGMPSGHSQSIAFFSTLCILTLINSKNKYIIKIIGIFILSFCILFIMYSRIILKCHTVNQTILGSFIGFILAYYLYKKKNIIKKYILKIKNSELFLFIFSLLLIIFNFIMFK